MVKKRWDLDIVERSREQAQQDIVSVTLCRVHIPIFLAASRATFRVRSLHRQPTQFQSLTWVKEEESQVAHPVARVNRGG